MDTFIEITIVPEDTSVSDTTIQAAIDSLLLAYEQRFSASKQTSEVWRVNHRPQNSVAVSKELGVMVTTGLQYGDTLDGLFDITILPLKQLWGLDKHSQDTVSEMPSKSAIAQVAQKVDYKDIRSAGTSDTLHFNSPDTRIDIGGIAKGYAIKAVGEFLDTNGYRNYLIAAGGDIFAKGTRANGAPWKIAIQHPRKKGAFLGIIDLDSGAVVTSGDYERYRIMDGKRVHHIVDPRTGYSAQKNMSVTIHGPDPVEVDILSTGLFCLDAKDILDFIDNRNHLECIVVDKNGEVFTSNGWGEKLQTHSIKTP